MENNQLDRLFAEAVGAIDRGDLTTLRRILKEHPEVGAGHALTSKQSQLDEALQLVAWSGAAAECGAQLPLIDYLVRAGAAPAQIANSALVNGHVDAARRLIELGGELTLASALCIDRWDEIPRLFAQAGANDAHKQMALVLAALNGKAKSVRWMLGAGVPVNTPSADLYAHGTPLHHAVCSGSLETVQAMVEGGADVRIADTAWNATPLQWAEHYVEEATTPERRGRYEAIVGYLRGR